ncbi:agmatine deiminase family protein [Arsenophonus endosymbiont of Aleurodicus floccissimus]|uniref:agmatine deiminase family protein n=1 Tax=Arsenophonus endosymbiont of Aleurodicus floccissimus TaxID=2152761 RepID=UPI0015FF2323|nr:agmatine deiminase family protein [Arsenophonus endosymbiont of Aleurodicus floccissimus]
MNYYLCHQAVIIPQFGAQNTDSAAVEILIDGFLNHKIIFVILIPSLLAVVVFIV